MAVIGCLSNQKWKQKLAQNAVRTAIARVSGNLYYTAYSNSSRAQQYFPNNISNDSIINTYLLMLIMNLFIKIWYDII